MTARGELFVDEDLKYIAKEKIDKEVADKYGKDIPWQIIANHYGEIYNEGDLPKQIYGNIIIQLKNKQYRLIGKVYATLKFKVEGEGSEKYIVPEVEKFNVEMFKEPKMWL